MKRKKVVVIGGGSGTSALLKGLKYFPVDITAIISVADNGKSTGRLRKEFSIPAIGDIRKVLNNLSTLPDEIKNVMEYRMSTSSDLNGHSMGNLILTSYYQQTKSLKKSIENYSKLLKVEHKVIPISEDCLTLMGETTDGKIIEGQAEIMFANEKYKRIFYKDNPTVFPEVFDEIAKSDLIILSMGSLYTSILPNLICNDVPEAIKNSKAKVMYICNAMTQPGETDGFTVSDHINTLEKYLGTNTINTVIVSDSILPQEILEKYAKNEEKSFVKIDYDNLKKGNYEVIEDDLLTTEDGTIKHDSLKLSSIIFSYLIRK